MKLSLIKFVLVLGLVMASGCEEEVVKPYQGCSYGEWDGERYEKYYAPASIHPDDSCQICAPYSGFLGGIYYDWHFRCCEIDGIIYQNLEKNPDNDCERCIANKGDHSSKPNHWTPVPADRPCDNGLCDGSGNCIQ